MYLLKKMLEKHINDKYGSFYLFARATGLHMTKYEYERLIDPKKECLLSRFENLANIAGLTLNFTLKQD